LIPLDDTVVFPGMQVTLPLSLALEPEAIALAA
jgi:hypothetical protein